jgi:hypothetical protein
MVIVQHLAPILPEGYVAAPGVHLGGGFEIDVSAYDQGEPLPGVERASQAAAAEAQLATATWVPPQPTLTLETDLPEQDEYEVRVYDARRGRRLVAAIELVSPSNKDRPESRRAFVAKIAALLQQDVCVSLVDVVTVRHFNLYADVLTLIGRSDPHVDPDAPHLYAATLRGRRRARRRPLLDTWFYPLALGQPLPKLPLWLDIDLSVFVDLEASYEDTCRVLRIA